MLLTQLLVTCSTSCFRNWVSDPVLNSTLVSKHITIKWLFYHYDNLITTTVVIIIYCKIKVMYHYFKLYTESRVNIICKILSPLQNVRKQWTTNETNLKNPLPFSKISFVSSIFSFSTTVSPESSSERLPVTSTYSLHWILLTWSKFDKSTNMLLQYYKISPIRGLTVDSLQLTFVPTSKSLTQKLCQILKIWLEQN